MKIRSDADEENENNIVYGENVLDSPRCQKNRGESERARSVYANRQPFPHLLPCSQRKCFASDQSSWQREINLEAKAKRENLRPFNTPSLTLSLHLQTLTRSLSLTVSFMVITLPDEPVPGVLPKPFKLWLMQLSSASTLSSSEFLQSRADTC